MSRAGAQAVPVLAWPEDFQATGRIVIVPELPEVESLAIFLRERAVGQVIDRADSAAISVLKTYRPDLSALHGRVITEAARHGKFLDLTAALAGRPVGHGRPGQAAGRCTWSSTWPARAGCAGGTASRSSLRARARGRWASGSGSPTAAAST